MQRAALRLYVSRRTRWVSKGAYELVNGLVAARPVLGDAGVGAGGAEELLDRSHSRRRAVAALQPVAVLP